MAPQFSEGLETGDRVKHDQTVTIRAYKASQKVHGTPLSQCSGGCGRYLTEDERAVHHCPGPRVSGLKRKTKNRRAMRKFQAKARSHLRRLAAFKARRRAAQAARRIA